MPKMGVKQVATSSPPWLFYPSLVNPWFWHIHEPEVVAQSAHRVDSWAVIVALPATATRVCENWFQGLIDVREAASSQRFEETGIVTFEHFWQCSGWRSALVAVSDELLSRALPDHHSGACLATRL
jgi:hypothetical protein